MSSQRERVLSDCGRTDTIGLDGQRHPA
jgi:hypothetical protein